MSNVGAELCAHSAMRHVFTRKWNGIVMLIAIEKRIPKKERIYDKLGSLSTHLRSKSIAVKLDKIVAKLPDCIEPRLVYSRWKISSCADRIIFENGLALNSRNLAMITHKATTACCFVATLGPRIDREINALMQAGKLSEAFLLDTAASLAIEDTVEMFCSSMHTTARQQGNAATIRFSPGYCDCRVNEQKTLFELVSAEKIGVKLTESALMQPRKTISGIFGIVPARNMEHYQAYVPCRECRRQNCISRRDAYPLKAV
jgi:alkylhydroperoxidase/carboxymuconolactone decarboxylase family protein YurZ